MKTYDYLCPKCKSHNLRIEVKVIVSLRQDGEGNIETIDDDANNIHAWGDESPMYCTACEYAGEAQDFTV